MSDQFNSEEEKRAYEARLQKRLKTLKQQFEEGKIKIAPDLEVIESLQAVRYLPNGDVDLSTVDGLVRSLALASEYFHNREELKNSATLAEIQKSYFDFLETNFGQYYKDMLKYELTPADVGDAVSNSASAIAEFVPLIPGFLETLEKFWNQTGDVAFIHVEDMQNLKGVFGGDLFPSYAENIASKCGIYTDTLILPDPFIRSRDLFKLWNDRQRVYYLIKHGLNLLQYKELACADVNPPIVVILPDRIHTVDHERNFILKLGEEDSLIHAQKVFGRKFDSMGDLIEFSGKLDTVDKVVSAVKDPTRVLFDTEWKGDLKVTLERLLKDEAAQILPLENPGAIVASLAIGRFTVCNEVLIRAGRLHGAPVIEAPTSWQYFVWKLEYDSKNVERETKLTDLHAVRALQLIDRKEIEWLGRVPPAALIEIRSTGAIHEIRSMFSEGIAELIASEPLAFHKTTDKVFSNIESALQEHQKQIAALKEKKWKFAGSDIGSWLVTGSLAVAAAATGLPVWGLAAIAADQLLDAPKLKEIPESIKQLAKESQKIKQSPVGILFKYKQ